MALQYPLLFPYGEDGFRMGISHGNPETGEIYKQQKVTARQYYAFCLQQRVEESQTLLRGGRLFQQFLVDAYACVEEGRMNWIRNNKKQLRAELYSELRDAINQGDLMTDTVGRMTILPSTHTGGPRYRVQNYQKRGLPHAHILVFLHPDDKIQVASELGQIISAEIPDKEIDPLAFSAVQRFLIHGPCGILNQKSPCMVNGKCSKHYPKKFHDKKTFDDDGFPIYMRRNNDMFILKNGIQLDSRNVAPYNRNLLVKYDAHINVELCNRSRSIKYLFKYINKGPDRVTAVIFDGENSNRNSSNFIQDHDEIKQYLDCRYISPSEAAWRIFQFNMFYREPAVERLFFHLPEQQTIYFPESMSVDTILNREGIDRTMFTEWMRINYEGMEARHLTYSEFPTKYVWNNKDKTWTRRRNRRCIGRIYYVPPTTGEKYYLRMLLNIVRCSISYEQIRTVNGVLYPTFKEACYALGLLEDDKEWDDCIKEASG